MPEFAALFNNFHDDWRPETEMLIIDARMIARPGDGVDCGQVVA